MFLCMPLCATAVEVPKLRDHVFMNAKVGVEVSIGSYNFASPLVSVKEGSCQWLDIKEGVVKLPIDMSQAPDTFIYLTT